MRGDSGSERIVNEENDPGTYRNFLFRFFAEFNESSTVKEVTSMDICLRISIRIGGLCNGRKYD